MILYNCENTGTLNTNLNHMREIETGIYYAHKHGYTGAGIGVAVVDTGICLHPDLTAGGNRIVAFRDFIHNRTDPYDENGHGTHVAGIIAGNGYASDRRIIGIAPSSNIIGVKVLDHRGNGNTGDVLTGLKWIIEHKDMYGIRIVNISVGTTTNDNLDENSPLVLGVNAVWDSGIVVVVAAGNNGPYPHSISTPGISRKVITVGASDDNITVNVLGSRRKDYSGRGPTNSCIKKPDIVAPGSNITSCNTIKSNRQTNLYTVKSGTSMATPIVSGAIALLLSKYPEMSNREVKIRIKNCAIDLGYSHERQGWGLIDIRKLLSD